MPGREAEIKRLWDYYSIGVHEVIPRSEVENLFYPEELCFRAGIRFEAERFVNEVEARQSQVDLVSIASENARLAVWRHVHAGLDSYLCEVLRDAIRADARCVGNEIETHALLGAVRDKIELLIRHLRGPTIAEVADHHQERAVMREQGRRDADSAGLAPPAGPLDGPEPGNG